MPARARVRRLVLSGAVPELAALHQQLDARAQYLQELRLEVALESAALPLTVLTGLDGGVKLREARLVPLEEWCFG